MNIDRQILTQALDAMVTSRWLFLILGLATWLALATCSYALSLDIRGVTFRSGHPFPAEDLQTALAEATDASGKSIDQLTLLTYDVEILKRNPSVRISVTGHTDTDECGDRECLELSLRRAQLVWGYLVGNGVEASRIDPPRGFGASLPIALNDSEASRQQNRRADVNVSN